MFHFIVTAFFVLVALIFVGGFGAVVTVCSVLYALVPLAFFARIRNRNATLEPRPENV